MHNFGAETHLNAGAVSALVSLLAAIAWVLASTFISSTALRKDSQRF